MVATAGELVEPAYQGRSLGTVVPAVAAALGSEVWDDLDVRWLPSAESYVVLLVDGLGYEQLRDHPADAPYLHSLLDGTEPARAGVPTTTATSLTSLGTALAPGTHGVVGYTSRIPGTDRLLNALRWDKRVDPRQWQPHPTAFARLAAAGVRTTVVCKREFESSGLTQCGQRGADFVGADRLGEVLAAVLVASTRGPSLTYMYDGDLDWTGHRYGVGSLQWRRQLSMVDAAVAHLRDVLGERVRLVVVADHGMVDSPADHRVEADDDPDLCEGVQLLGGEARFRHVYCRGGAVDDVLAAWRERLGGRAEVLSRDDAVARGWFGPVLPSVRPRLGDVLAACRGDFAIQSTSAFPHEVRLRGLHGSLTSAEMLVPVLVA